MPFQAGLGLPMTPQLVAPLSCSRLSCHSLLAPGSGGPHGPLGATLLSPHCSPAQAWPVREQQPSELTGFVGSAPAFAQAA